MGAPDMFQGVDIWPYMVDYGTDQMLALLFFIDARDIRQPTSPPAVPSRASMKKMKTGAPPWLYIPNIYIQKWTPKQKIWAKRGHIYGLYMAINTDYILLIYRI